MDKTSPDFISETAVLNGFIEFLKEAIEKNEKVKMATDQDVSRMLKEYSDENVELYNQISVGLSYQNLINSTLKSYKKALAAPFFARIDFHEENTPSKANIYIGKTGVNDQETNETLIVDWRAPVANLYYNCDLGRASYDCLDGTISGDLSLKRTFTIENGEITDLYDSDVVTNDTLLQEYLAKNSDVVLKDIVATIQKDQNEIIRINPWVNVIVQGVAGSGKTTVAMHRIAYILYTFPHRYKSEEFVIIGANKMFLNYVAGMLPELGVESIRQMILTEFLASLLDIKEANIQNYCYDPKRLDLVGYKSSLGFVNDIESYLNAFELDVFQSNDIVFYNKMIMTKAEINEYGINGLAKSITAKRDTLKNMLEFRVKNILPSLVNIPEIEQLGFTLDHSKNIFHQRAKLVQKVKEQARNVKKVFDKKLKNITEFKLYKDFLENTIFNEQQKQDKNQSIIDTCKLTLKNIKKNCYDIYDLSALALIKKRLCDFEETEEYKHIVIDEAQDFGIMVFDCLNKIFTKASFTIMGDVSQNISLGTGIDDWDFVESDVFKEDNLDFRVLSKSYRNTIEIAEYANIVLKKLNRTDDHKKRRIYDITPVVRHGDPVLTFEHLSEQEMIAQTVKSIKSFKAKNYKTTSIICKTQEECDKLYAELSKHIDVHLADVENTNYEGGVTIFPIQNVKGMEFDSVIIFEASKGVYHYEEHDIKLLYVALTRGLHELHIINSGEKSELFN